MGVNQRKLFNPFLSSPRPKKKGPSVETERPLTIACHMKIRNSNVAKCSKSIIWTFNDSLLLFRLPAV
jgi:hypothetical protein